MKKGLPSGKMSVFPDGRSLMKYDLPEAYLSVAVAEISPAQVQPSLTPFMHLSAMAPCANTQRRASTINTLFFYRCVFAYYYSVKDSKY